MKIGIIGLGLIGGSIAQGLKEKNYELGAYDIDEETLKYAYENKYVDEIYSNLNEFLKNYRIIYLCLYPNQIINFFKVNKSYIQSETVFIEVSGIKSGLINQIKEIDLPNIDIVFTHPIAGKESSGIKNSDFLIFKNSNYVIVDNKKTQQKNIDLAIKLAKDLDFDKISVVSMETHDDLLAYTSHLTHLISMALVNSYEEETNIIDFAGDSYRDLTRIAKNNSVLWSDIFDKNSKYLLKRLDLFMEELNSFKKCIENNDSESLKLLLEKSNKLKQKYKK